MRTGLTKREKTTAIYFDEYGSMIEVQNPSRVEPRETCRNVRVPPDIYRTG